MSDRMRAQNLKGEWTARNNGAGKRRWFCFNERTGEYHNDSNGNLIRYTMSGAIKRADALNAVTA